MTEEHAKRCISMFDKNGDATLSFNEFVLVLSEGQIDLAKDAAEVNQLALFLVVGREMRAPPFDESPPLLLQERRRQAEIDGPELTARKAELMKERADEVAEVRRRVVASLQRAWGYEAEQEASAEALGPADRAFAALVAVAVGLANSWQFGVLMNSTILLAGLLVGIAVDLSPPGTPAGGSTDAINGLENFVLAIFTVEIVVKVLAEGKHTLRYFNDAWYEVLNIEMRTLAKVTAF